MRSGGRRRYGVALAWLCWLLFPVACWAKPVPWEITADSLIHYKEPESIFAEGNVILSRPKEAGAPLIIKADWIRYDVERSMVKARGNVSIDSPGEEVAAESAKLNLNTQVGTMESATIFLVDNHLYIKGEQVDKTGEQTYTLHDGWASACRPTDGSRPAWSIESKRANLTVDGMAHLTHARLNVKETPVLYSPYLLFPAKTKRETGFLFPEWSHSSRDGFGFTEPFFVNLSPSSDVTLYPSYMSERGLMAGVEFRYAANPKSQGAFLLSQLRDRLVDTDKEDYKNDSLVRVARNRYWLRGKADHDFGNQLVAHLDLDFVSDQDVLQEFRDGSLGYDKSSLEFQRVFRRDLQNYTLTERESSAQLIKSWGNMVLSSELRTVQDTRNDLQLVANDGDGTLEPGEFVNRDKSVSPLQTLPRLDFTGRVPLESRRLSLAWDTEYVNYWRDRGVGAQRLDLHPQLITALPRGGWVEGRITGGLRETAYQMETYNGADWGHDKFQERTAFDFEGNMATLLMRDFDLAFGAVQWLEHTIRPNLKYEYLTRTEELPDIPAGAVKYFDSVDRLAMKNWLTYEWNNYFDIGGNENGENFWNRQLGYFKLLQTYNIREGRRELAGLDDKRREFSDLRFDLLFYPLEPLQVRYQTNVSMYGQGVTRYELLGRYSTPWKASFALDYRYLKHNSMAEPYFYTTSGESRHDLQATVTTPLTDTITAYGYINKSFSTDHTVESSLGFTYKPHCWMVEVETRRATGGEQSIMVIFSLDGIGRAFRWGKEV